MKNSSKLVMCFLICISICGICGVSLALEGGNQAFTPNLVNTLAKSAKDSGYSFTSYFYNDDNRNETFTATLIVDAIINDILSDMDQSIIIDAVKNDCVYSSKGPGWLFSFLFSEDGILLFGYTDNEQMAIALCTELNGMSVTPEYYIDFMNDGLYTEYKKIDGYNVKTILETLLKRLNNLNY